MAAVRCFGSAGIAVQGALFVLQFVNLVAVFVIIALLSSYFSKNMIVNLSIAILATILIGSANILQEGFDDKEGMGHKKEKKEGMKGKKKTSILH